MIHLVSFFARIEPQQFQECFLSWINSITQKLELEVIAIDGKTMKQSYDRNHGQKPLHIVSAWSSSHQLVLGQKKVNKKSNEGDSNSGFVRAARNCWKHNNH